MTKTLTNEAILSILHEHSFDTREVDEGIEALEFYMLDGKPGSEWVRVPTTIRDLFNWMGY